MSQNASILFNPAFCVSSYSYLENCRSYSDVLHIQWLLYYQSCRFSVLELDARYEWRGTPSNTHRGLFPLSYFCVYGALRHITKLQVMCRSLAYWTTAISSETLFVWFRVALKIQLENYDPRYRSVILVCVYFKPAYTSLIGTQLCLATKLTYLMTACM